VTVWNSVPILLEMLLIAAVEDNLDLPMRLVLLSGDRIALDLPRRLVARARECRVVALGGATEAAIWSNAIEITQVPKQWRSIPYGTPLSNQKFRVVDVRGRDCPDWVAGEMWIGGVGVAQGYRGDSEGSASQFVEHDGERWYRTGDLGCYWPDGTLEFLGRADFQVKIRGHRIELGEIEAALEDHPGVARAVAALIGEKAQRIAAAIVTTEPPLSLDALRKFLTKKLPSFMLPEQLAVLERLPLNANGKLDRKQVARLLLEQSNTNEDDPPEGEIELLVAATWAELLGIPKVGRNQSFFTLGGDSLLATRLAEVLRHRFGTHLSLRQLFLAPTVAELATSIIHRREMLQSGFEEGEIA
jgi:yersiniabactin nonribosomal peptide synthetase